jgi:hypothetical protein
MADKKISALSNATTPLAGTEVLPIVQSGSTVKVSVANLTAGRDVSAKDLNVTGSYTQGNTAITIGTNQLVKDTNGWFAFGTATTRPARVLIENEGASGNPQIMLVDSNSFALQGELRFDAGDLIYDYWDGGIVGRTEKFRAQANDDFRVTLGNLVLGTAGKGIDFSANTGAPGMTSELLDWYEEGAFTPVITSSSGTITSYTATGFYNRIGQTITVHLVVNITDPGSASGNLVFSGLPFTAANVGLYAAVVTAREDNVTGSSFQVLFDGNATTGKIAGANWSSNVKYFFGATYLLA